MMMKNLRLLYFLSRSNLEKTRPTLLAPSSIIPLVYTDYSRRAFQLFTSSDRDAPAYNYEPDSFDSNEDVPVETYKEVKRIIELWVKDFEGVKGTEQQDENLKAELIRLANLVKDEEMERARLAKEVVDPDPDLDLCDDNSTNSRTIKNREEDSAPDTTASKPTTLLELIRYILGSFDDDKLRELKFKVSLWESLSVYFKARDQFEAALKDVPNDRIEGVLLNETNYPTGRIQQACNDVQAMLETPNILLQRINNVAGTFPIPEKGVLEWNEFFVEPTERDDLSPIAFCSDYSKGSAIVVAGESGSGKTWFSQKYIPNKLDTRLGSNILFH